jgi:imidazolonepropionase-like amidohydrolase
VPAADALRTCTATAAQVCGVGDRKGRIAPGYDADLMAVPGDPLADLAVLHRPVAVFARGERVR